MIQIFTLPCKQWLINQYFLISGTNKNGGERKEVRKQEERNERKRRKQEPISLVMETWRQTS